MRGLTKNGLNDVLQDWGIDEAKGWVRSPVLGQRRASGSRKKQGTNAAIHLSDLSAINNRHNFRHTAVREMPFFTVFFHLLPTL